MLRALIVFALTFAALAQSPQLTPLEKEFQDSMTAVVLEGQSTRDGRPGVSDDKYTIDKVAKNADGTWTFHARIQYGGKDVSLPLPLKIEWAGDTPVITVTDQSMMGLGTYTARVLIYRGHYAGTWSGRNGGGKVFGHIVKQQKPA